MSQSRIYIQIIVMFTARRKIFCELYFFYKKIFLSTLVMWEFQFFNFNFMIFVANFTFASFFSVLQSCFFIIFLFLTAKFPKRKKNKYCLKFTPNFFPIHYKNTFFVPRYQRKGTTTRPIYFHHYQTQRSLDFPRASHTRPRRNSRSAIAPAVLARMASRKEFFALTTLSTIYVSQSGPTRKSLGRSVEHTYTQAHLLRTARSRSHRTDGPNAKFTLCRFFPVRLSTFFASRWRVSHFFFRVYIVARRESALGVHVACVFVVEMVNREKFALQCFGLGIFMYSLNSCVGSKSCRDVMYFLNRRLHDTFTVLLYYSLCPWKCCLYNGNEVLLINHQIIRALRAQR